MTTRGVPPLRELEGTRKSPIKQLEYEGYLIADATYAVDNATVAWNEQAALKRRSTSTTELLALWTDEADVVRELHAGASQREHVGTIFAMLPLLRRQRSQGGMKRTGGSGHDPSSPLRAEVAPAEGRGKEA
jgi:hypothetical protein